MTETAIIAIAIAISVGVGVLAALIMGRNFWFKGGGVSTGTNGPATKATMSASGRGSSLTKVRQIFRPKETADYRMTAQRGGKVKDAVQGRESVADRPTKGA